VLACGASAAHALSIVEVASNHTGITDVIKIASSASEYTRLASSIVEVVGRRAS
jgi:hypothetical protein